MGKTYRADGYSEFKKKTSDRDNSKIQRNRSQTDRDVEDRRKKVSPEEDEDYDDPNRRTTEK